MSEEVGEVVREKATAVNSEEGGRDFGFVHFIGLIVVVDERVRVSQRRMVLSVEQERRRVGGRYENEGGTARSVTSDLCDFRR